MSAAGPDRPRLQVYALPEPTRKSPLMESKARPSLKTSRKSSARRRGNAVTLSRPSSRPLPGSRSTHLSFLQLDRDLARCLLQEVARRGRPARRDRRRRSPPCRTSTGSKPSCSSVSLMSVPWRLARRRVDWRAASPPSTRQAPSPFDLEALRRASRCAWRPGRRASSATLISRRPKCQAPIAASSAFTSARQSPARGSVRAAPRPPPTPAATAASCRGRAASSPCRTAR